MCRLRSCTRKQSVLCRVVQAVLTDLKTFGGSVFSKRAVSRSLQPVPLADVKLLGIDS